MRSPLGLAATTGAVAALGASAFGTSVLAGSAFGLHRRANVLHGGRDIDFAGFFAFAQKHGNGRIDLHAFAAFGNQDLADAAFIDRLEFHGGLVGLDFGENVAGLDGVAFLHQPAGKLALFHGGRQSGHQDVRRHGISPCSKRI
jgi:hypothetical protein